MILAVPLFYFLIAYAVFLGIFIIFSIINLSHLHYTGALTFVSFLMALFMGALAVGTLFFTYTLLAQTDWQTSVTLFNSAWITNIFNFNTPAY